MTEVAPLALDGLDTVAWAELNHNHGSAEDVPRFLRTIAEAEPAAASEACADLSEVLFHLGGWVCSAATAALPFLLALAGESTVSERNKLLELVEQLVKTAGTAQPRSVDPGWDTAWKQARLPLEDLLADPEATVRRLAIRLLATDGAPPRQTLGLLLKHWDSEQDLSALTETLLALGMVASKVAPEDAERVHALLAALTSDPRPALRLAAVHAWRSIDPQAPRRHLDGLVEVLTHPDAHADLPAAWANRTLPQLIARTHRLLADDPATATELVHRLAIPQARADVRAAALDQAGFLLSRRRSPTTRLLTLGGLLAARRDPESYPELLPGKDAAKRLSSQLDQAIRNWKNKL